MQFCATQYTQKYCNDKFYFQPERHRNVLREKADECLESDWPVVPACSQAKPLQLIKDDIHIQMNMAEQHSAQETQMKCHPTD